jgi:hypothetical protein
MTERFVKGIIVPNVMASANMNEITFFNKTVYSCFINELTGMIASIC